MALRFKEVNGNNPVVKRAKTGGDPYNATINNNGIDNNNNNEVYNNQNDDAPIDNNNNNNYNDGNRHGTNQYAVPGGSEFQFEGTWYTIRDDTSGGAFDVVNCFESNQPDSTRPFHLDDVHACLQATYV